MFSIMTVGNFEYLLKDDQVIRIWVVLNGIRLLVEG
jgi:hypothetical protein